MISPALFHPAFPIQPPPLRGTSFHRKEGVSTLAPSLGRGCRAQRGGVGFLFLQRSGTFVNGALEMIFPALFHPASALSAPTGHLPLKGKALSVVILFPHMRVFALTLWGKRFSRIVAFPIEEGGPRQRCSGAFVNCRFEMHFLALFHPSRTLSGSLRSPPSPRGEGWRYEENLLPANLRASPHIYLRRSRHHNPEP